MLQIIRLLASFPLLFNFSESYKILVVFPIPGKSHGILGAGVVNHLLNHGHQVTYITPFVKKNAHSNLTQIDVSSNFELMPKEYVMDIKTYMSNSKQDVSKFIVMLNTLIVATLEHSNVQKLLQDPNEKFDLVILEWLLTEILSGIAAVYDTPYIWVSTVEPHWLIIRLIDESLNPAYNCDTTTSQNFPPLNFLERASELSTQIVVQLFLYMYQDPMMRNDYERLIAPIIRRQGREPPLFDEVKYNASLVLGNSHVSLGQATRLPQNYKPIAGYHIDEKVKPLSKDLQKIMDEAKAGVIYFSMGSNIRSDTMPEEMKMSLLKMFGELKQTVLWKFEDKLSNLPKNVHIFDWAPQQSILAHPNCILFISHGGLLSTTEAVHFGVPIIGIPVTADQFINVARAVNKGFAEKVPLGLTMHKELKVAIEKVIGNPSYAKQVEQLSFVYHHRPARPGAELVHWAEHVIQTNGAPHLKSLALRVPWYQKMYLDLAVVVIVLLTVTVIVLKRLFRAYFSKTKVDGYKKKK